MVSAGSDGGTSEETKALVRTSNSAATSASGEASSAYTGTRPVSGGMGCDGGISSSDGAACSRTACTSGASVGPSPPPSLPWRQRGQRTMAVVWLLSAPARPTLPQRTPGPAFRACPWRRGHARARRTLGHGASGRTLALLGESRFVLLHPAQRLSDLGRLLPPPQRPHGQR
jgi:hypothetical protein